MLYPPELGDDPLFPRAEDFSIVFKDKKTGKGVITYRSFKKGEIMARITGHSVPDIRQHTLQLSKTSHNFDPYFSGYFLHSCAPNISVNMKKMTVTALEDIAANSFLIWIMQKPRTTFSSSFPVPAEQKIVVNGSPADWNPPIKDKYPENLKSSCPSISACRLSSNGQGTTS